MVGPTQSVVKRVGLWMIKLLTERGHPLSLADLQPMLLELGIISDRSSRSNVANAVAEFADDTVYIHHFGYWLKRKPWPAAGYHPRLRKQAA